MLIYTYVGNGKWYMCSWTVYAFNDVVNATHSEVSIATIFGYQGA